MSDSRILVAGSPVDNIDMQGVVRHAETMIQQREKCTIFAMNPEKAIAAREDPELYECLNSAGLLIADGIGIILASRIHGVAFRERVPGSELMPKLCQMAAKNGYGVFLFGAKEEVNKNAADKLVEAYPGLQVVGRQNGYVSEAQTPALIEKINSSGAQLLFVALGSPKQEYWMSRHQEQLNVIIQQGVGGTFDVLAGNVKRAPALWRRFHMEWLYRLLSQPQRFLRQSRLPAYVWLVIRSRIGLVKT
ncbi:N-acetylglucosaminyldiphosphoundecaprenol N-acetyl-beta-D-mannosaminyltransferase [Sinobacterium caligoides]|uniref:N-acetylglucosaminyldiphosphoundecaprenol N-acetyl-beta-D-mannosaminyltransferase n=1 Tax=Sinobacterium caligoides TaxID=933926 RepID=A0A3N2DYU7_9GAMM|nr:WecB/TagA/CpsF family glycosyltransferase [Sinobacterium caligoides]ROS05046.1 N-acetylglucosaminyldiphosphoundecaprenol N-acetyl-beta-D-mannosaminyltransferase [Sinobacterium caligoides]